MGMLMSRAYFMDPEIRPDFEKEPIFDPQYGFSKKRKQRQMIATEEELDMANITPDRWDYCTHIWLEFLRCRHDKYPLVTRCKPIRDVHTHCQYEDWVLRTKEFEREKRLLERARRKRLAQEKEAGPGEGQ